jgi:hypothetical protein
VRPPDLIPDIVMVPVVGRAIDLHTCEDCTSTYPAEDDACTHGRYLCGACLWTCRECSVDLEDDLAAELAHDSVREGA